MRGTHTGEAFGPEPLIDSPGFLAPSIESYYSLRAAPRVAMSMAKGTRRSSRLDEGAYLLMSTTSTNAVNVPAMSS